MTTTWRTVRVFISSTFKDMQAERDHLVRFVFPRLREELLPRRIHLVDVDLRWGVTTRTPSRSVVTSWTNAGRAFSACWAGRYGWVPPGKDRSITADEVHYGVLDRIGQHGYAFFYFRHGAVTERMDQSDPGSAREPKGSAKAGKLASLKRDLHRLHRAFVYHPSWNPAERRLLDLQAFGNRVERDILASVEAKFGEKPAAKLDEFAQENAAMAWRRSPRNPELVYWDRSQLEFRQPDRGARPPAGFPQGPTPDPFRLSHCRWSWAVGFRNAFLIQTGAGGVVGICGVSAELGCGYRLDT